MSKTLSRFVEPKGSGISNPLRQTNWASVGPDLFGGEGGIRTLEGLQTLAGFQDQCIQPLCHLSGVVTFMRRRILLAASNGFNQTSSKY